MLLLLTRSGVRRQCAKRIWYSTAVDTTSSERKAQWKRTSKSTFFIDTLAVQIKGGQGGDGCIAFSREKYKAYGPPSGASGGKGGNVYIEAVNTISSLARISNSQIGERGQHGTGECQVGKKGKDRVIQVPIGTVVTVQLQESEDEVEEKAASYERDIKRKYRAAYLRTRRTSSRLLSATNAEEEDPDPFDKRSQRDAVWRHYPGGALTHAYSTKEGEDGEAALSEEELVEQDTLSEANSDIAGTMANFRDSERRLAFTLLEQEVEEKKEMQSRNVKWGVQEVEETGEWSVDLIEQSHTPLLLASGGSGGLGNAFFLSSSNKSPKMATKGGAGQTVTVNLEWKFKGDVGLIGLPNAGKSTFLKSVCETGEDVRVGSYAFTTLSPNVGVVRLGEEGLLGVRSQAAIEESGQRRLIAGAEEERTEEGRRLGKQSGEEIMRFTLQDLPGLVEGASDNRGLGHAFLKHVERCLALYYVVDVRSKPWQDMMLVHAELESYQAGLSSKVRGVIANKCDLLDPSHKEILRILREKVAKLHGTNVKVYNISAKHRQGVERVAREMANVVWNEQQARAAAAASIQN
jgi:GTP-binding protein